MANLDQICDYLADKANAPLRDTGITATYADLSATNGWTAPVTGFMIFGISPSNTSEAYALLRNITSDYPACNVQSQGGRAQNGLTPIFKGQVYKISASSTNVQSGTRTSGRVIELLGSN